ncbi:MAG: DUF1989 domain-containing protein [Dongiaceae bacterium]
METIPARQGKAVLLAKGHHIRVINTHGTQVVDCWAFAKDDISEWLSMEHSRELRQKILFEVGDLLVTNRYRLILTIVADSSPGEHDTLVAACSRHMYRFLGADPEHANCADNLDAALSELGFRPTATPSPWNLFMSAPVRDGRLIEYRRPRCRPGDAIELRAEMDCVVAFSACPDDYYPTNGGDGTARDAHFLILDPAASGAG